MCICISSYCIHSVYIFSKSSICFPCTGWSPKYCLPLWKAQPQELHVSILRLSLNYKIFWPSENYCPHFSSGKHNLPHSPHRVLRKSHNLIIVEKMFKCITVFGTQIANCTGIYWTLTMCQTVFYIFYELVHKSSIK